MKRTHLSLYYLVGYLLPAGIALIAAPKVALKLLLSNGNYGDVLPRLLGMSSSHRTRVNPGIPAGSST
jgi:hypothetical protein